MFSVLLKINLIKKNLLLFLIIIIYIHLTFQKLIFFFLFLEYTFHKNFKLDNTEYQLDVLDTSGDDTYTELRQKWFQYGQGFIFVCNLTSRLSVKELELF